MNLINPGTVANLAVRAMCDLMNLGSIICKSMIQNQYRVAQRTVILIDQKVLLFGCFYFFKILYFFFRHKDLAMLDEILQCKSCSQTKGGRLFVDHFPRGKTVRKESSAVAFTKASSISAAMRSL